MQPDQALLGIEIARQERQGAAAAAGSLHVQPQEQRVERRVVAGGCGDLGEFVEPVVGQCHAGASQPARFGYSRRRVLGFGQDAVGDRVVIQAAERGDQVLSSAPPAAGVAALDGRCLYLFGELADFRGGGLGDAPARPCLENTVPVRGVDTASPVADCVGNLRDVVLEDRNVGPFCRGSQKVGQVDSHLLQQQAGGLYGGDRRSVVIAVVHVAGIPVAVRRVIAGEHVIERGQGVHDHEVVCRSCREQHVIPGLDPVEGAGRPGYDDGRSLRDAQKTVRTCPDDDCAGHQDYFEPVPGPPVQSFDDLAVRDPAGGVDAPDAVQHRGFARQALKPGQRQRACRFRCCAGCRKRQSLDDLLGGWTAAARPHEQQGRCFRASEWRNGRAGIAHRWLVSPVR